MHNYVLLILIKVSFEFVAEENIKRGKLTLERHYKLGILSISFTADCLHAAIFCKIFIMTFLGEKKCFGMNSRNAAAWTLTTLHECVKKNYECSSWCRSYITFQYFCHGYVKKYDGKQILSTLYLYITNSWFIFFVYYLF